jgi:hypothetical protein
MLKRKVLITIVCLILAVGSAYAIINPPDITALNASTYVAVTIPETNGPCRAISFYTDDGVAFSMAVDSAGTSAATMPANTFVSMDCVTDTSGVIFYVRAGAGTPNLIVLIGESR